MNTEEMEKIIKEKKGKPKMEEEPKEDTKAKKVRFTNTEEIITLTAQKAEEIKASDKYNEKQKIQIINNLAKINKIVSETPLARFGLDWVAFLKEHGIDPQIEYVSN